MLRTHNFPIIQYFFSKDNKQNFLFPTIMTRENLFYEEWRLELLVYKDFL